MSETRSYIRNISHSVLCYMSKVASNSHTHRDSLLWFNVNSPVELKHRLCVTCHVLQLPISNRYFLHSAHNIVNSVSVSTTTTQMSRIFISFNTNPRYFLKKILLLFVIIQSWHHKPGCVTPAPPSIQSRHCTSNLNSNKMNLFNVYSMATQASHKHQKQQSSVSAATE